MTIIGLAGPIGSGKSFTQLKYGLQQCERKQKLLVTNFEVNMKALFRYCKAMKYDWLVQQVLFDRVTWIINPKKRIQVTRNKVEERANIEALMIPESVVLLDEAGISLNARNFAHTSQDLLADLAQSRKMGTDLIWAAQFNEQVDKQVRMLTQFWIHCKSVSFYDKKMRRPSLKWKKIYYFDAFTYNLWLQNPRDCTSHWKTRFAYAFDYEGGFLTGKDKLLFDVYASFDRLDLQATTDHVRSPLVCPVPKVRKVSHLLPPSKETLQLLASLDDSPVSLSLSPDLPPTAASCGGGEGAKPILKLPPLPPQPRKIA